MKGFFGVLVISFAFLGLGNAHALQLTGTHAPYPVVVGGKLTFTFTLDNDEATTAAGTVFTNRLSLSTIFVSAVITNGTFSVSNNVFSYSPDSLPPGGRVVFKLVVTPVTAQPITNRSYWIDSGGNAVGAFALVTVAAALPGPELNVGRVGHLSTLLPDCRVLLTGGLTTEEGFIRASSSAEVYDMAAETFTLVGNMNAQREGHTATLLPNETVAMAGGKYVGVLTASVDLFDPATNGFRATANLSLPRAFHTATLLANGDLIFAGGAGTSTLIERFHFTNGNVSVTSAGNLAIPRFGHLATLLADGRILFAGGGGDDGAFAEVFNLETGISSPVAGGGHLIPAVAISQGKVLLNGYTVSPHIPQYFGTEIYDIQSNSFSTPTPPSNPHRSANSLTLKSGEVLITAGQETYTVDIFNPRTGNFTPRIPVVVNRYRHSAVELTDGRILLTGGYDLIGIQGGDMRTTELYVTRLDLDRDGMDDAWELANQFNPDQRADAIEDADGDGHTNLQEYLAGTGPHDPNSVMRVQTIQKDANTIRIQFTSVLDRFYCVERATTFLAEWTVVADNIRGTGALVEVTDSASINSSSQLYRVRLLP